MLRLRALPAFAFAAFAFAGTAHAKSPSSTPLPACRPGADWNEPAPPRRIYANAWYVGTCGLTSLLLTGDDGHVLLDGEIAQTSSTDQGN